MHKTLHVTSKLQNLAKSILEEILFIKARNNKEPKIVPLGDARSNW